MSITFDGRPYQLLFGSDVQRDGVYLELNDVSGASPVVVLFAFYSDADGRMTFSAYREDVPFEAVEWFTAEARRRLPSVTPAPDAAGGSSPSRPAG